MSDSRTPLLDDALFERNIKAVCFDFDGVFTDNRVLIDADGKEFVLCDRGDGIGLANLKALIPGRIAVFSSEKISGMAAARCAKLGIQYVSTYADKPPAGLSDVKLAAMISWCADFGIAPAELVFCGNDVNDIGCLRYAGIAIVPDNVHEDVMPALLGAGNDVSMLTQRGGSGFVRAVCDAVVRSFKAKALTEVVAK